MHTTEQIELQEITAEQNETTDNFDSTSQDFSNFNIVVGDNPYLRRPHRWRVHLYLQNHRLLLLSKPAKASELHFTTYF